MLQTKRLEISGTASTETTDTILTGIAGTRKHITRVMAYETTGTRNNDAAIVGYIEQLKVVDTDVRLWLDGGGTPLQTRPIEIPLDRDLAEGESLDIGFVSGSTASDFVFVVEYEETSV